MVVASDGWSVTVALYIEICWGVTARTGEPHTAQRRHPSSVMNTTTETRYGNSVQKQMSGCCAQGPTWSCDETGLGRLNRGIGAPDDRDDDADNEDYENDDGSLVLGVVRWCPY